MLKDENEKVITNEEDVVEWVKNNCDQDAGE